MTYRIVLDSAGEMPAEFKNQESYASVALTLRIGGEEIIDDGHLDQKAIIKKIADTPLCPKTACPSPEVYRAAFDCGAEHIYCVTISAALSGSYQSAVIGSSLYKEKHPEAKIHIFNSRSTSVAETMILYKIKELEDKGVSFEETVERTEEYIALMRTYFVLDNLETLRKNGRLSNLKALAASVLKIKPVCCNTQEGEIGQLDQARGINRAIVKMVDYAVKDAKNSKDKILGISHCNCGERAIMVRDAMLERIPVKEALVVKTGGLSTVYSNDGGIILVL